jgi:spore maturation protein SpmB
MIRWDVLTEIIQLISTGKAENVDLSTLTTNPQNAEIDILNLAVRHSVSSQAYRVTEPLGGVGKKPALYRSWSALGVCHESSVVLVRSVSGKCHVQILYHAFTKKIKGVNFLHSVTHGKC